MHLLPILWATEPTDADWHALRDAKAALNYEGGIQPARAVLGSPGRILVVGDIKPDWACDYAPVESAISHDIVAALGWCLELNEYPRVVTAADLLSSWFGCPIMERSEDD